MSAIPLRRIEGKYEILEKLGEGGMGAVYKVRHRLLDDVRVIKMMRPQLVADDEFKARFQREAQVAIKLRHPNIAHLIDFTIDEEDGTAFIVMEFIDGMTLEEVLRHSGPPPLGLAVEIGQQALRALACLHEKGFVHRDISPDNLMLTADADGQPLVKLIDLGIAKILGAGAGTGKGNLTGTGIFLGKVRYSSPEQFGTEGAAMVDARGDLYSLAVVLYELLTGRYPIQGRDPSSLIAGHLFRPPLDFAESDPAGKVPADLRALILRALAKEPGQRFATSREMGAALGRFRAPGDLGDGDLKRALTRLPSGTVRVPLTPPGSTQDRLNAQFGLHTTPSSHTASAGAEGGRTLAPAARRSPEIELRVRTLLREAEALLERNDYEGALAHLERGKALAPGNAEVLTLIDRAEAAVRGRRRTRDLTAVQEAIEAALARHDYRAAEMRLYQAEASFGEQEVFTRLHERLGELRRRDLEARRRAERLMAVVQGIEAALAGGDLEEGDRLLAAAAADFGEEPEIAAFRVRSADLRQAARQAEIAAREAAWRAEVTRHIEIEAREAALQGEIAAQEARRQAEIEAELVRHVEIEAREAERQAEIARQEAARRAELRAQEVKRQAGIEAREAALQAEIVAEEARRLAELEAQEAARLAEVAAGEARRQAELEAREAERLAALAAEEAARQAELERAAAIEAETARRREEAERAAAEAERRRGEKEAERAEQLAAAVASIDAGLDAGDPEGAARLLPGIVAIFGDSPVLRERWERVEEARRQRELETALAAIDEGLERGDPAAAARLLPAAVARFGGMPALRERWERLESLQRQARVEALRGEADALVKSGHVDRAARKLRQALELAPDDREIAERLARLAKKG